jgi:hypothetical protein
MKRASFVGLMVALFGAAFVVACDSKDISEATSKVVGKAVELGKGLVKGVNEGVKEGRKAGESVDEAIVVTNVSELEKHGGVTATKSAAETKEGKAKVVLVFENTSDKPLRITGLQILGFDKDAFTKKPLDTVPEELTVPAVAKEKLALSFATPQDRLAKVRVWDKEITF